MDTGGMRRDIAMLLVGAALASCASNPKLEVRPVGVAATRAAGDDDAALGRGALAIGNVGLALEQFRQALRARPDSLEALGGIAQCYDEMGRADLARRYYEEALALAPADLTLLRTYAASLARHGASAEAQAVIAEIALRTKAPAAQWVIEDPRAGPVAADPARAGKIVAAEVAARSLAEATRPWVKAARPLVTKVRLERLSLGEIALVTTGTPLWSALPAATAARPVRLLNAARRQGLAARHREQLAEAGWRRIVIGDAGRVRLSSLILYPTGQRVEARRLGDKLRIAALRPETRVDIVVLLGRDRG